MLVLNSNKTKLWWIFVLGILLMLNLQSCSSSKVSHSKSKYSTSNKRSNKAKSRTSGYAVATKKKSENITKEGFKPKSINTTSERQSIVEFALQHNGTKYRSGGKTPETGFDCSGFTNYVFNNKGIQISGPSHQLAHLGHNKPMSQLIPGDLVFFGKDNRISHVAIVAENKDNQIFVVHSTTSSGVKVDNISASDYWSGIFLFGRDILTKSK